MTKFKFSFLIALTLCAGAAAQFIGISASGQNQPTKTVDAELAKLGHGYIVERSYTIWIPFAVASKKVFASLHKVWEPDVKEKFLPQGARSEGEILEATIKRYGFFKAPYENQGAPLGFRVNNNRWEMSCTACHSGMVKNELVIGRPNTELITSSFVLDLMKYREKESDFSDLSPEETVAFKSFAPFVKMTQPERRGVFNVWAGGVPFLSFREPDLEQTPANFLAPKNLGIAGFVLNDPLPWWNTQYKSRVYVDGIIPSGSNAEIVNGISPLVPGATLRNFANELPAITEYFKSLEAPKYKGPIDFDKAGRGRTVFENKCATCHGTYAANGDLIEYPNKIIELAKIKTDPERAQNALPRAYREYVKSSWLGNWGKDDIFLEGTGYMPPPLKGVWASAPYLHNGSVPTLAQVLDPDLRRSVWKVKDFQGYDDVRMGLEVEEFDALPADLTAAQKEDFYDSSVLSQKNEGHLFGKGISSEERALVLEYLKTL